LALSPILAHIKGKNARVIRVLMIYNGKRFFRLAGR